MTAPTLYLVDASLYVFRAWHSMPDEFHDADGWPTNAVHGFARFLLELLERERPRHIAIAFDESLDSCFRNAIYPAYKANRDPAPPELRRQFAWCKALCKAVGLVTLAHTDYEADDLIGTAVHVGRRDGFRSVIVSADKDLSQLLQADDEQYDFAKAVRWKADGVKARHGVHAQQIADYLALTGDAVDNIPGVTGIGAKSAAILLAHFQSLDALLTRARAAVAPAHHHRAGRAIAGGRLRTWSRRRRGTGVAVGLDGLRAADPQALGRCGRALDLKPPAKHPSDGVLCRWEFERAMDGARPRIGAGCGA